MNDSDKIKMTINIGGEHFQLSVDFDKQDLVRDAEKAAHNLFSTWRTRWSARPDKEILAKVAYQFAYYYQELLSRYERASEQAEAIDRELSLALKENREM